MIEINFTHRQMDPSTLMSFCSIIEKKSMLWIHIRMYLHGFLPAGSESGPGGLKKPTKKSRIVLFCIAG